MFKKNDNEAKEEKNIVTIIKGSLVAIAITIIGLLIFSLILTYTNVKESAQMPTVITIMAISIIVGSIISTRKVSKKGLLNGGLVGLIYILVIYLLSSIFVTNFSMNTHTLITIIVAIIAGTLGGVIGVNLISK